MAEETAAEPTVLKPHPAKAYVGKQVEYVLREDDCPGETAGERRRATVREVADDGSATLEVALLPERDQRVELDPPKERLAGERRAGRVQRVKGFRAVGRPYSTLRERGSWCGADTPLS